MLLVLTLVLLALLLALPLALDLVKMRELLLVPLLPDPHIDRGLDPHIDRGHNQLVQLDRLDK